MSVFRTNIYAVFVIDRTGKKTLLMKWFNFVFTKDLPSINQSNIQVEKKSNMIYINYKIVLFFFFEVYFEAGKMYTNQLNLIISWFFHS